VYCDLGGSGAVYDLRCGGVNEGVVDETRVDLAPPCWTPRSHPAQLRPWRAFRAPVVALLFIPFGFVFELKMFDGLKRNWIA